MVPTPRQTSAAYETDAGIHGADQNAARMGVLPEPLLRRVMLHMYTNWRVLVLGAVLAAVIAAVGIMLLPPTYRADALIAPTRSRTDVQFDSRAKTINADASAERAPVAVSPVSPERRQALADLVKSDQIASRVHEVLAGNWPPDEVENANLLRRINGTLMNRSEIIAISAIAATPADAVALANTWAKVYVEQVNRVYVGDSGQDVSILTRQRDAALSQAQEAQAALVAGLQNTRVEELTRRIADLQQQIVQYQAPYQSGSFATGEGQKSIATGEGQKSIDSQTAREDFRLAEVRTLDDVASLLRRLEAARQSVQVLLNQANAGQLAPSDRVSLAVLKSQLVSFSDTVPAQLQLQIPADGALDSSDALRALDASLAAAVDSVRGEFERRRATYEGARQAKIAEMEDQVRQAQAQSESDSAVRRELALKRDNAWNTYSTLASKVEERRVAEATGGREVELASAAANAERLPKAWAYVAVAFVGGLVLTSLLLLLALFFAPSVRGRSVVPAPAR